MTHDRYEGRRPVREARGRFSDDRQSSEDRGFFERAGDEVASWFGDDEAERRRRMDSRGQYGDDDQGRFDRQPRFRDEGYRRPYTGRTGSQRGFGDEGGYRPMTGDYGRAPEHERMSDKSSFSGMAPTTIGAHDRNYHEWRQRQIDELDRDYDDYRRENQSRFDSDFSQWRSTRQGKRQMLGQVREHMQVVGSDDQPVGKVDKVRGDRIMLTKNDSPDGQHHLLSCSQVDRVEDDRVILDKPADEAIKSLSNDKGDRALFERDDDRESGAHILNRSFSGTY